MTRNFGLDFIRAIAITLVVLSHITLLIFPTIENTLLTIIRVFGAIGVDLFFVLSGYLIGGILLKQINNQQTKFKHLLIFWQRRWFRTLPNYFLILVVNIFIFLILGKSLPEKIWKYFLFLQNFLSPHPNFFTEAWSLSVEEYAYLILPLVLYVVFNISKTKPSEKQFLKVTILLILGLFLLKVHYFLNTEILSYSDWSSTFRKVVIFRIDAIYFGFLVVYIIKNYPKSIKKYKNYFLIIGLFLLFGIHGAMLKMHLLPETNLGFYVFVYLQVVVISLAFIFPYFINLTYQGIFEKVIRFLSIHSYSIYLVNYSLILLTFQYQFNVETMTFFQKGIIIIAFIGLTLITSVIIYRYFEQPILKYRDHHFKRNMK
jgi:peptidoglycan/LPS O-acetylase OafA/YrhL